MWNQSVANDQFIPYIYAYIYNEKQLYNYYVRYKYFHESILKIRFIFVLLFMQINCYC